MRYALVRRGPARSLPRRWRASRAAMRREGGSALADRATTSAPATDVAACARSALCGVRAQLPKLLARPSRRASSWQAARCRSASAGAHSGHAAERSCRRCSGRGGECGVVRGPRPGGAAVWLWWRDAGAGWSGVQAPPLVARTAHTGHTHLRCRGGGQGAALRQRRWARRRLRSRVRGRRLRRPQCCHLRLGALPVDGHLFGTAGAVARRAAASQGEATVATLPVGSRCRGCLRLTRRSERGKVRTCAACGERLLRGRSLRTMRRCRHALAAAPASRRGERGCWTSRGMRGDAVRREATGGAAAFPAANSRKRSLRWLALRPPGQCALGSPAAAPVRAHCARLPAWLSRWCSVGGRADSGCCIAAGWRSLQWLDKPRATITGAASTTRVCGRALAQGCGAAIRDGGRQWADCEASRRLAAAGARSGPHGSADGGRCAGGAACTAARRVWGLGVRQRCGARPRCLRRGRCACGGAPRRRRGDTALQQRCRPRDAAQAALNDAAPSQRRADQPAGASQWPGRTTAPLGLPATATPFAVPGHGSGRRSPHQTLLLARQSRSLATAAARRASASG